MNALPNCSEIPWVKFHAEKRIVDYRPTWILKSLKSKTDLERESLKNLELLNLVVGVAEAVVQHPVDDVRDVGLERVADAGEDVVLVNHVEGHAAALQDVQNLEGKRRTD